MPSALSVCARNLAIGFLTEQGLQDQFDYVLGQLYADLIYETPLLGGPPHAPVHWSMTEGARVASFSQEIDKGHILGYFLYLPSITRHETNGFKSTIVDEGQIWDQLNKLIEKTDADAETHANFKRGQAILVDCGWGKGFAMKEFTATNPAWQIETISVADLTRVSWLNGMSPEYFVRVQDGLRAVEENGLEIFNINGVLNLIAWSRQNSGDIVPHDEFLNIEVEEERPITFHFPQNLLRDLRAEADQARDLHRIQDNEGKWRLCQHKRISALFDSQIHSDLYICLEGISSGELLTVLEGELPVWVAVTADDFPGSETVFGLWEMAQEWLPRIVNTIKDQIPSVPTSPPLLLKMIFEGNGELKTERGLPDREALLDIMSVEPSNGDANLTIVRFRDGFVHGFRHPENVAERVIVEGMFRAIMQHLELHISGSVLQELVDRTVQNNDARSFHAIHGHDFLQYVAGSLPRKLVTLNEADAAIVKLGLAQKAISRKASHKINGVDECCSFLETVVDGLLDELKADLSKFGRLEALERIFLNIEKSGAEEDHWRRTSTALIGLHGETPETLQVYVEQSSKFSAASVTGRILLEIGLCECPEDGDALSSMELSRMMAKASILYRLGGLSDAIKYQALPAELHVSPFGDILFKDDFNEFVVQPVLSKFMGQRFKAVAPKQHQNYEEPTILPTTSEYFEADFWVAWKNEFGFDIDEGRHFLTRMEDEGIRRNSAVYQVSRTDFVQILCGDGAEESSASDFIDTFSLKSRKNWAKPPRGMAMRDIYPWAFSRRLSIVSRPILQLDSTADPLMIVAPHSIRAGFGYLVSGAHGADLPQDFFKTDELRNKWWGKASEGHTHAKKVADRLKEEGWEVHLEIRLPHVLNKKFSSDVGDIDILAWRKDCHDVWVIEAKDLSRARNHSEMAHMLSEYQGMARANGEPDKLLKHLRRVEHLKNDLNGVTKFCKVDQPTIRSALICSGVVPMQYAKIEALEDTFVGDVDELIESLQAS